MKSQYHDVIDTSYETMSSLTRIRWISYGANREHKKGLKNTTLFLTMIICDSIKLFPVMLH